MGNDLPELTVTDAGGWRAWLGDHHRDPTGVWLVPAKKGTTEPTSLMYDQALDEALCIQRRLVALRTLEFLTFWTYLANRGVWEALVGAGPTCTVPATDEDIGRYLDVYESLVAELTAA